MSATLQPDATYKFQIKVDNVYKASHRHPAVSELYSEIGRISGWVRVDEILGLMAAFPDKPVILIPSSEYWANWDFHAKGQAD